MKRLTQLLAVLGLLLLPGCSEKKADVVPGDMVDFREEFRFFFYQSVERYFSAPVSKVRPMFSAQEWDVPPGMTLNTATVAVESTQVSWRDGNEEISAEGYLVRITGSLSIAEEHQSGEATLRVRFPDLVEASKVAGVTPRVDGNTNLLTSTNSLLVQQIAVHESQVAKLFAAYGAAVLVPLAIVVLLFVAVGIWMMQQGAPLEGLVCECCGRVGPTRQVSLYQNIGVLIARFADGAVGTFCKSCIRTMFWRFTVTTFFLGWWGIISIFMTPFILANNILQFIRCRGMPSIPPGSDQAPLSNEMIGTFCKKAGDNWNFLMGTSMALHQVGQGKAAIVIAVKALKVVENKLGSGHPSVAMVLNHLAGLHWAQGETEQAEELLKQALHIAEEANGPEDEGVAAIRENLMSLRQEVQGGAEAHGSAPAPPLEINHASQPEPHPSAS